MKRLDKCDKALSAIRLVSAENAVKLILDTMRKEGRYDHVEVCVKIEDAAAIHLYEKHGFADSGYIDEDAPDSLNMICHL